MKNRKPAVVQGIYRHFSGKLYWFSGECSRNAITKEMEAEYYTLYPSEDPKWTRPIIDCFDEVRKGEYAGKRFVFLIACSAKHLILPGSHVIHKDLSREFWCHVVELEEEDGRIVVRLEGHKYHKKVVSGHAAITEKTVPLEQFLQTYIPFK